MLKALTSFILISATLWGYPAIEKMDQALPYLNAADAQTLVVFDIDYTLTMPNEPAFHMTLFKQYKPSIKEWIKNLTEEEKFWLAPYLVVHGRSQLIEQGTPHLIASLQQKGVKAIALTACPSIELPSIGNLAEWRNREFQAMGIDFYASFPLIAPFQMTSCKEQWGTYPGYYRGILFCNSSPFLKATGFASKGEVLRQFLEKADWKPHRVIFVDDDSQNLDSVGQEMEKWGVSYTGLLYTGAQSIAVPSLSEKQMEQAWMDLTKKMQSDAHIHTPGNL